MRYLVSFFFFSISLYGFNYHLKPYKISDGIHCFFGLPSQANSNNGGNMINSCYVETSEGYLVIDSGPTYSYAEEAYSVMQEKKRLAVKYVINTSDDEEHVLGNGFYKERGAKLLGPKGYKNYIEKKATLFLETKLKEEILVNTHVVPLDKYIEEDESLIFDNIEVSIKTLQDDTNHLYVYIKEKKIVFAGDLVYNNRIVPIENNRSIVKWLKELEELSKLDWLDIISSHGYMTRRSALKNTKTYLSLLKNEVFHAINNGKTRKETIKNVKILSFSEDKFYKTWHPKNVANAYDELKALAERKKVSDEETELEKKISDEMKVIETAALDIKKDTKVDEKIIVKKRVKEKVLPKKSVSSVKYRNFNQAINIARKKRKIVLVKVRSTICKYCDQLDSVIARNATVRRILNKYFEVVKVNIDYTEVPMSLTIRSTPTLIFIRPDNKKVLMNLAGIRALGELLEILNEAVTDGHNGDYLKP